MKGADGVVHAEDRVGGFFFAFLGLKTLFFIGVFLSLKLVRLRLQKLNFVFFVNKMGVLPSWGLG